MGSGRFPTDAVREWSVVGLGGLVFLVPLAYTLVASSPDVSRALVLSVPVAASVVLVLFGSWLVRAGFDPEEVQRIAAWCVGGALALGLWEGYLHVLEGTTVAEAAHEILIDGATGAMMGAVVGYYDAHQRRERRTAERARNALEASMDGIAVLDEDGEYVTVNDAHAEVYGYDDPETFVGESWRMCYPDDELERFDEEVVPELWETGAWRGEATGVRPDGSTFPQELSLTTMDDGGMVCVIRDVSERKRRERQLHEIHEATLQLSNASSVEEVTNTAVAIADDVLDRPFAVFWRYDSDEDVLAPRAATEEVEAFVREKGFDGPPVCGEGSAEMQAFRADETQVVENYGEVEGSGDLPLGTAAFVPVGEYGLLGYATLEVEAVSETDRYLADILARYVETAVDRATSQRELERAERRFRALTENSPVGVVTIDGSSTVQFASAAVEDILGYAPEELEGEPLTTVVPERLRESHREGIRRYLETGERELDWGGIELPGLHADGHEVDLGVSFGELRQDDDHLFTGLLRDVSERKRQERQIRALQDATLSLMDATTPTEVGERAVDIARDVLDQPFAILWTHDPEADELVPRAATEEVRAFVDEHGMEGLPAFGEGSVEMRAFRTGETQVVERYREAEGSSDFPLGTVAFAPLGDHGLLGFGSLDVTDVVTRVRTVLETLTGESDRELRPVDLAAVVAEECDRVRETYPAATVETDVTGAEVVVDDLLAEVVGNLVTNAVEHNDPEGLHVRVSAEVEDGWVTLRVADDGSGVPDDAKEAVFRRGATGHAKSTGSGFGLFFVDAMVETYGGTVRVEDNDEGGATFVVELPTPDAPAATVPGEEQ